MDPSEIEKEPISEKCKAFILYFQDYKEYLIELKKFSIYSNIDQVNLFKKYRGMFLDNCRELINSFEREDFSNKKVRELILVFLKHFELFLSGSSRIRIARSLSGR